MTARADRRLAPALASPMVAPPGTSGMGPVLERNIAAMQARREQTAAKASLGERVADAVTRFAGSMVFVYLHIVIVAGWVACQIGWIPGARFDKSFVILATAASVEGIFLTTFVLISQNRQTAAADRRADLDVQVNLLTEHEVTRLIALTQAIADHLGLAEAGDPELSELEQDVAPEAVLDDIEARSDTPPR